MSAEAGQPYPDQLAAPVLRRVQRLDAKAPHPSGPRAAAAHGEPSWEEFLYNAWQAFAQKFGHHPDAAALSQYVRHRDEVMDAHGRPLPAEDLSGFLDGFWQRQSGDTNPGYAPAAASAAATAAHATEQGRQPSSPMVATQQHPPSTAATPQGKTQEDSGASPSLPTPTAVDHYYLAWHGFQQQHGKEPNGAELSAHLAERNVRDREGKPIKPKALTRYFLEFRIYTIWADHREHRHTPAVEQIVADLAQRGIAAQYNRPIQASDVAKYVDSFERRWNALAHHRGAFPD